MWLIEQSEKRFLSDNDEVGYAAKLLRNAHARRELSLVVGNSPSRSAAWLHQKRRPASGNNVDVSWLSVVVRAAQKVGLRKELIGSDQNLLALAQAVIVAKENNGGTVFEARGELLSELNAAFHNELDLTAIDRMFVKLRPSDIVTTNYDFQLERAFEKLAPGDWSAFVRHGKARGISDKPVWIHKMHGSFNPKDVVADRYQFSETFPPNSRAYDSVVITEYDYDTCYREVGEMNLESSSLMRALTRTCLIIGKSLDEQDLSFMYALRRARRRRRESREHAFMLFNEPLTQADKLHLHNLGIEGLVINLPVARNSGHYYFGLVAALARLFPDLRDVFEEAKSDIVADFASLVRGPTAVAIGLASRNVTGVTTYNGQNLLPPPGRRNLRYGNVEEHLGGSAATPLMILSHLDVKQAHRLSMVSAIGEPGDSGSDDILLDSNKLRFDIDAVSRNQKVTWHSTVLVHTSETHDKALYTGQRIFLDRGYNDSVELSEPEEAQLHAQLKQQNLRVLYIDKFLASQHPPPKSLSEINEAKMGPLLRPEVLRTLAEAINRRPQIDVIYETGGGGSAFQHVEHRLRHYVNVFTAGFPFFASQVLHEAGFAQHPSLTNFDPQSRWWEADFAVETKAIDELLALPELASTTGKRIAEFAPPEEMLTKAGLWAGRAAETDHGPRRWLIVTLHHFGALGLDLERKKGWVCRAPSLSPIKVENTSGAGDTFRGALLYALLEAKKGGDEELPRALRFATDVATERCRHFKIWDACKFIEHKFGGHYSHYETQLSP